MGNTSLTKCSLCVHFMGLWCYMMLIGHLGSQALRSKPQLCPSGQCDLQKSIGCCCSHPWIIQLTAVPFPKTWISIKDPHGRPPLLMRLGLQVDVWHCEWKVPNSTYIVSPQCPARAHLSCVLCTGESLALLCCTLESWLSMIKVTQTQALQYCSRGKHNQDSWVITWLPRTVQMC